MSQPIATATGPTGTVEVYETGATTISIRVEADYGSTRKRLSYFDVDRAMLPVLMAAITDVSKGE